MTETVMELNKCPKCGSEKVQLHSSPNHYRCRNCNKHFTLSIKGEENDEKVELFCYNCKNPLPFNGKNRFLACNLCGFKIFVTDDLRAVDPYSLDQGIGTLELDLTSESNKVGIVPLGDVHVGAPKGQCDLEKVQRELDYILDTPDTYMLGMGDLMDCAQKVNTKGPNLFASSLQPMEQLRTIENMLKPLADKGKILGLLTGNHEEWIMTNTGMQVTSIICQNLNVPYLGAACDINIKFGEQYYTFYALHGSGNAQLKHTKLGRLMNCSKDIFADALIMGHVHQLAVAKGGKYIQGDTHKAYYILTGHFLNWVGSYAQAFGMDVCPSGCPKIAIYKDRKDVHVSI